MNFSKVLVFKESIPTFYHKRETTSGSLHFFFVTDLWDKTVLEQRSKVIYLGFLMVYEVIHFLLLTRDFASYTIINPGETWYITHIP